MKKYTLRRPTWDDFQAIYEVINASRFNVTGVHETTEEEVRSRLSAPHLTLATESWVVESPEGQVVAFQVVEQIEHARLFVNGDVHPDHLGQGIGMLLLQAAEQWAQEQVQLAVPDLRVVLNTPVNKQNTRKQHLFERHAYQPSRPFWRMGIELTSAPVEPRWPEGIELRTLADDHTPERLYAVYEADQEIFQDHWGYVRQPYEEWKHWAVRSDVFDASLWFLALAGDDIVGIGLCADEQEAGAWVHALGIKRSWRRRGLAQVLLQYAFGEFYRRGRQRIFLNVDGKSLTGATRVYERAGMHVVRETMHYEKELRAGKELSTQSLEL
ncbi:GNAT family N-acetyltransferase [Dictyobacter arantiisoli]|nr:GNAT family N-acetyltransferase [Dictyobacter arantiisoli]